MKAWEFFYNALFIPVFGAGVRIGALLYPKVRRGLAGRDGLFASLERQVRALGPGKRVWVHSSSMGEFEQAKPIIAELKHRHPDVRVIVSFFSPSGYDHSRSYRQADIITYIPFDSSGNARRFIDLIKPEAAVFVRYDVWPNHIWELRRRGIPVFLANATMRGNSSRLRWPWRSFHRLLYDQLTSILTVSEEDAENFRRFGLASTTLMTAGETRYDQVLQRSDEARTKHLIPEQILKRRKIVVAGSTWPEDEEVLLPTFRKLLRYEPEALLILVPHEPTEEALDAIERALNSSLASIRFSALNDYRGEAVILVDSIGILMALYRYAQVAFVGGSFRQNVHNVLEPAVYGIPVLYGPRHRNSQEAVTLAQREGGFVVQDSQDMYRVLRSLLRDVRERKAAGDASMRLVREHAGATERFLSHLEPILWPPVEKPRPALKKR